MDRVDIINMICGQPFGFHAMYSAQQIYGEDVCSYNDKTGIFKWNREKIKCMQLEDILDLCERVKKWNTEESKMNNKKIILNAVSEKKCYYKCNACGYDRVAQEDIYCSMCGEKFNTAR